MQHTWGTEPIKLSNLKGNDVLNPFPFDVYLWVNIEI